MRALVHACMHYAYREVVMVVNCAQCTHAMPAPTRGHHGRRSIEPPRSIKYLILDGRDEPRAVSVVCGRCTVWSSSAGRMHVVLCCAAQRRMGGTGGCANQRSASPELCLEGRGQPASAAGGFVAVYIWTSNANCDHASRTDVPAAANTSCLLPPAFQREHVLHPIHVHTSIHTAFTSPCVCRVSIPSSLHRQP